MPKAKSRKKKRNAPRQRPEIKPGSVYDVPDISLLLDCSERHTYNLINSGQLRTFKSGKLRRATGEALLDHISEREEAAA